MPDNALLKVEFADNPEPRCPVVLLLDTSGSMAGEKIGELNEGLAVFEQELKADPLAALRVEVAIVTFGPVRVREVKSGVGDAIRSDAGEAFVAATDFMAPNLSSEGNTPMGEAIRTGLKLLRERKQIYKQNAIQYYRPWMFLITDGEPNDDWKNAARELRAEEDGKGVLFFAIGVDKADMDVLGQLSGKRGPMKLRGMAFREMFQWLSPRLAQVSRSRVNDAVNLPPPGWGQIDTSN